MCVCVSARSRLTCDFILKVWTHMAWSTFIAMENSMNTNTPCLDPLKLACGPALQVHLYYCSQSASSTSTLSYTPGDYITEELCIKAARECGEHVCKCVGGMRLSSPEHHPITGRVAGYVPNRIPSYLVRIELSSQRCDFKHFQRVVFLFRLLQELALWVFSHLVRFIQVFVFF